MERLTRYRSHRQSTCLRNQRDLSSWGNSLPASRVALQQPASAGLNPAARTSGGRRGLLNLEFRRAGPSDVEEAIPLIYSSGPHELDYAFAVGRHKALDFLRIAFVDGSSTLGYGGQVVAVLDGHVVGIGASHDGAEYGRANMEDTLPSCEVLWPRNGRGCTHKVDSNWRSNFGPRPRNTTCLSRIWVLGRI